MTKIKNKVYLHRPSNRLFKEVPGVPVSTQRIKHSCIEDFKKVLIIEKHITVVPLMTTKKKMLEGLNRQRLPLSELQEVIVLGHGWFRGDLYKHNNTDKD